MNPAQSHTAALATHDPRSMSGRTGRVRPLLRAIASLVLRDWLLLVRRPSRIAATLLTPVLLWAFFAGGFTDALAATDDRAAASYSVSLAAGAASLVVTFASIFGALGLIRDRETGYLQSVLVGPVPRTVVLGSRVGSGALFAFIQAVTMLFAALLFSDGIGPMRLLGGAGMLMLMAIGLSGVCTALAWRFQSIEGFHGVMAGILLPSWLLSGAVFPADTVGGAMSAIMLFNPLAYTHGAIAGMLGTVPVEATDIVVTAVFGVIGFLAATLTTIGDAKR